MTSYFTSISGLKNAETDLRVIAHNIANAETAGFKKSSAQFSDLVARGTSVDPRRSAGIGATVSAINQDFSLGAIEQTGRSLDLAINGDGFFTTADQETGAIAFSRNGNMRIVGNGEIQDANGGLLQVFPTDAAGNVTSTTPVNAVVPTVNGAGEALSSVSVNGRGIVEASYADGSVEAVGRVALARFAASGGLQAVGQTQWIATGDSGPPIYGNPGNGNYGQILSGSLERSNVDLAEEMVALITAQRNFQANARAIDTATQISQTVINLQS